VTVYSKEMIPALEREIEERRRVIQERDKDYSNTNPIGRLLRIIEFLELGCTVETYLHSGFIINGTYIVGTQRNRWTENKPGMKTWKSFRSVKSFVKSRRSLCEALHHRLPQEHTGP
jgi:hypothetical protein